jgi:ribosomal protein S18 acetylase RimI-like enzyme
VSALQVEPDGWLSECLGYPAFRVVAPPSGVPPHTAVLQGHLRRQTGRAMYYAKVDTVAVETLRALAEQGFYVVDTNVNLRHPGGARPASQEVGEIGVSREVGEVGEGRIQVADCTAADAPGALAIAGSAMKYSRFHLDPAVPLAVAHHIKREWIRNYVNGARGEALLVARIEGKVVGFNAVLRTETPEGPVHTIDLIAVDVQAQRRGVGRALVAAFIDRYAADSAYLQVGTQVANLPSLALYQQLGFHLRHTSYVLHYHTAAAQEASA